MIKAGPPVKKFTGAGSIWGPDMLYLYCTIAICCMYPGSRKRAAIPGKVLERPRHATLRIASSPEMPMIGDQLDHAIQTPSMSGDFSRST